MGSGDREPGHRRAGRSAGTWEGDSQAEQLLQCPPRGGWTGRWMQERKPLSARRRKERQKMGSNRNAARAERG